MWVGMHTSRGERPGSALRIRLDAAGVALYSDQQAIDSTTPMGRAMIQMAFSVRRAGTADHPQ